MNHIMTNGQDASRSHTGSYVVIRYWSENEPLIRRTDSKIIASYEIVCGTARRESNMEYFELGAQSDHRIE